MSYVDETEDYTKDDDKTPFDNNPGDEIDYEIAGDAIAPMRSGEEIEQESSFKSMPVGTHEVVVIGFLIKKGDSGPITTLNKKAWFGERREDYKVDTVTVKFGLVGDTSYQALDTFEMPPSDPKGQRCYYEGTKEKNGKGGAKGFLAKKFCQFMERGLGWPYGKGQPFPPEARKLSNWKGRRMLLTIKAGDKYEDAATGEEKTYKNGIELFSYRPTSSTMARHERAAELAGISVPDKTPAVATAGAEPPVKRSTTKKAAAASNPDLDNI